VIGGDGGCVAVAAGCDAFANFGSGVVAGVGVGCFCDGVLSEAFLGTDSFR